MFLLLKQKLFNFILNFKWDFLADVVYWYLKFCYTMKIELDTLCYSCDIMLSHLIRPCRYNLLQCVVLTVRVFWKFTNFLKTLEIFLFLWFAQKINRFSPKKNLNEVERNFKSILPLLTSILNKKLTFRRTLSKQQRPREK